MADAFTSSLLTKYGYVWYVWLERRHAAAEPGEAAAQADVSVVIVKDKRTLKFGTRWSRKALTVRALSTLAEARTLTLPATEFVNLVNCDEFSPRFAPTVQVLTPFGPIPIPGVAQSF